MSFTSIRDIDELIKKSTDEGSPFPYEIQEQLAEMKLDEREGPITVIDAEHDGSIFVVETDGKYFRAVVEHGIILDDVGHEVDNEYFEDRVWTAIDNFIDKYMRGTEQV